MIERLRRALEHVDELSLESQEELAELIEEQTALSTDKVVASSQVPEHSRLPKRIRTALAAIGSARDLQGDDEFAALDRIRHESTPTPPIEFDDL